MDFKVPRELWNPQSKAVPGIFHTLQWRHNGRDGVSNHQPHHCSLNSLFRRKSKKTSKLRVTRLCAGNSPGTGEFPAQMASNTENISIWWRHHDRSRALQIVLIFNTGLYTSYMTVTMRLKPKIYLLLSFSFFLCNNFANLSNLFHFSPIIRRRSNKTSKLRVTGLMRVIHRRPVNSPHKVPVTRKMFPLDDVIMTRHTTLFHKVISRHNGT